MPYRRPEPLPDWVYERKTEIIGRRSPAQVRRCLKDWMLKSNRETQNKFLSKPMVWADTPEIRKTLKVYPYGPEETIAYSNYFFPGRYSVTKRLFKEIQTMLPDFAPRRIVDFGCGPGTGAAVAVDVFGRDVVRKYAGVDMSKSMQDAAQIMTRNLGIDCHFWSKTSDLIKRALNDDSERFDLAICSYTLTELANDPARRAAVQILYELLDCGGVVVFLEKGNPEGSFMVRTARQLLLSLCDPKVFIPNKKKSKGTDGGDTGKEDIERPQYVLRAPQGMSHLEIEMRTIAPCTHDKPCPLSNKYFCSFSQKVFGSMIQNQQAEKYSYAIMQKRKRSVFVKDSNAEGHNKLISFKNFFDDRTQAARKEIVFENRLHSRMAGGKWLDDPTAENPKSTEQEFPTPITILKRFQALGKDGDQPLMDEEEEDEDEDALDEFPSRVGGRKAVSSLPERKRHNQIARNFSDSEEAMSGDETIDKEAERLFEKNFNNQLDRADFVESEPFSQQLRAGGRKQRPYLARLPEFDDEDDDDDFDDTGDGTISFKKPKTRADKLVDELIDEVDWEEYNPPLYRSEWGRILR